MNVRLKWCYSLRELSEHLGCHRSTVTRAFAAASCKTRPGTKVSGAVRGVSGSSLAEGERMASQEPGTTPDRPTPEEPMPAEPGTMPDEEPKTAPEPPTMPEEPDVGPSESRPE
jgi:DNA-binding transcriptional MocR family regulator